MDRMMTIRDTHMMVRVEALQYPLRVSLWLQNPTFKHQMFLLNQEKVEALRLALRNTRAVNAHIMFNEERTSLAIDRSQPQQRRFLLVIGGYPYRAALSKNGVDYLLAFLDYWVAERLRAAGMTIKKGKLYPTRIYLTPKTGAMKLWMSEVAPTLGEYDGQQKALGNYLIQCADEEIRDAAVAFLLLHDGVELTE